MGINNINIPAELRLGSGCDHPYKKDRKKPLRQVAIARKRVRYAPCAFPKYSHWSNLEGSKLLSEGRGKRVIDFAARQKFAVSVRE